MVYRSRRSHLDFSVNIYAFGSARSKLIAALCYGPFSIIGLFFLSFFLSFFFFPFF